MRVKEFTVMYEDEDFITRLDTGGLPFQDVKAKTPNLKIYIWNTCKSKIVKLKHLTFKHENKFN